MKTIGMIVAVELQSVLKRYGAKLVKRKETAGYQVLEYETDQYRMVIVNCGPGEIAAASGTQFLISEYHVDIVMNFGVVGVLRKRCPKQKSVLWRKLFTMILTQVRQTIQKWDDIRSIPISFFQRRKC